MRSCWSRIEQLPSDWSSLASPDLAALGDLWAEQREKLKDSEALREFNERLRRSWAIETGILENIYSLDRGITQVLVEHGLEASLIPHGASDTDPELLVRILRDQAEALDGVMDFVGSQRPLSTSYIRQLHQLLTRHQTTTTAMVRIDGHSETMSEVTLIRGEWKRQPNNPTRSDGSVFEYCPPEQVPGEMERLVELALEYDRNRVAPEVQAAWLHHRFTQIHPFQDGNGRVARALASLVLVRAGWFPLVVDRDSRESYISALEAADDGELAPLVKLFVRLEKRAFMKAVSLSHDVQAGQESVQQVLSAALERLRKEAPSVKMRAVFETSSKLESVTSERFAEISSELERELRRIDRGYYSINDASDGETQRYFKYQLVKLAHEFDYYANTSEHQAWVRIRIHTDRHADIIVSFHGLGYEFMGIMAAVAFIEYRSRNDEGETSVEGPYGLCGEPFQFSYNEQYENVCDRYGKWLNEVLVVGLDMWRRQL